MENYEIKNKIGTGTFGDVFLGTDKRNGCSVAIKRDIKDSDILHHEYKVYMRIMESGNKSRPRIPKIYHFDEHHVVMEYLGDNLGKLFTKCMHKFSVKTVCMLAIQIVDQIACMHSCGFIHRDIKPENFVMGRGKNSKLVHIIDLGLSKRYKTKYHIKERSGKGLVGTARYTSINSHLGLEQSRRDDLESIGYMFIYFVKGRLPWQNMDIKDKNEKYKKIAELKKTIPLEELCKDLPDIFLTYMKKVRELKFKERPNYRELRALFSTWMIENKEKYDSFDWS